MRWSNHDEVLAQLRDAGLLVDRMEVGGRPGSSFDYGRRCKTIDHNGNRKGGGWYALHELVREDGEIFLIGAYGNFRTGISERISLKGLRMSAEERAAANARIAADRKRAEAQQRAAQARAARRAWRMWDRMSRTGTSEYLERKGVGAHGVRFSDKGTLVVPVCDGEGKIHGLQFIGPAVKEIKKNRDKDVWPPGLAKKGHFHLIGAPTWIVLVVEGYATGATLHEATGWPVAVAFDAGNLQLVAKALHKQYREARILIAADDDFKTEGNPGIAQASQAALAVGGSYVVPVFTDRGERKLTDFNDLHQAEGLHVVTAQLTAAVRDLGWQGHSAAPAPHAGGEGESQWAFSVESLRRDYALIYGTDTVYDAQRRRIVALGPLRSAAGKGRVREWLEHPDRRIVEPDEVVFDPTRAPDDDTVCNLWGGWPTSPRPGSCERLLEMLEHLCSNEDNPSEVYDWLLCWMAYPIQHPGAKMATAILMHGPEGSGKNQVFGAVRRIYGRYGGIFSQTELESQFNGWASGKLFMIGNEVVSRMEMYHQQGRLKNMITEGEWQVNEKNLPVRLEANHCNFVFFSNRIDIARLDPNDRRYCVIWTPPPVDDSCYVEVAEELRDGGAEALHDHLLQLELGEFSPHSKPPQTRAKRELIELGMDSTERFWKYWTAGHLAVECGPCTTGTLYDIYRQWAAAHGIPKPAPSHVLLAAVAKKPGAEKRRSWLMDQAGRRKQQATVWPPGHVVPDGVKQEEWLGKRESSTRAQLLDWKEGAA